MTDALLIIDMQQGSFGAATPRHDAAGLVGRLNRLAGAVRATGGAVVFIQHDGPPGDPHHPDQPGWRLLDDPHLAAVKIIEHHNAIWSDFLAPSGPALVCPCADVRLA